MSGVDDRESSLVLDSHVDSALPLSACSCSAQAAFLFCSRMSESTSILFWVLSASQPLRPTLSISSLAAVLSMASDSIVRRIPSMATMFYLVVCRRSIHGPTTLVAAPTFIKPGALRSNSVCHLRVYSLPSECWLGVANASSSIPAWCTLATAGGGECSFGWQPEQARFYLEVRRVLLVSWVSSCGCVVHSYLFGVSAEGFPLR
ncbi:hypothetical protein C8F01DRAFT_664789 [Mycena amicta]|nr:hypothetical protein C8F01DRAFT_664789 [Mycena amicta]